MKRVPPLLLLFLVPLLTASPTRACTCTYFPPLMDAFGYATAVFGGTVTDIQDLPGGYMVVTFTPTIRWKGAFDDPVKVYELAGCNAEFWIGGSYRVFATLSAYDHQPVLWTDTCAYNRPLDEATIAEMPAPELPVPAIPHTWGALKSHYR